MFSLFGHKYATLMQDNFSFEQFNWHMKLCEILL